MKYWEEGRDEARRQKGDEDRRVVTRHAGAGLLDGDAGGFGLACRRHQAVLPNRPAGLTSSTIAMMTKITTEEPSG